MSKPANKKHSRGFRLSREFTQYHRFAREEGCEDLGCSHCINVLGWANNIQSFNFGTIIETSGADLYGVPQMNIARIFDTWYFNLKKLPEYCTKNRMVYSTDEGEIIQGTTGKGYLEFHVHVFSDMKEFNEERQREEELKKQKAKKR